MKKIWRLLVAALLLGLSSLCVMLAVNLDREKRRAEQEAQQRRAHEVEIERLRSASILEFEKQAKTIVLPAATDQASASQVDVQTVDAIEPKATSNRVMTPDDREATRAEERLISRREYGPLFQLLALTPQQQEEFLDIHVEDIVSARYDTMTREEIAADMKQRARERVDKVSALLGPERAAIYEDYVRRLDVYASVTQIGMQLDAIGSPLSNQQRTYLVDIIMAEEQRVPPPSTQEPISSREDIERELDWLEDHHRRITEGAASVLSLAQLKYLEEYFAARAARRRVDLDMIPLADSG